MFKITIGDIQLQFETHEELFSPKGADAGTVSMLSQVHFTDQDKVLDLGCGYGLVGVYAAKLIGPERVFLADKDETAVRLARHNAALNGLGGLQVLPSDGFSDIGESDFTKILINPPYHVDFSVPKHFIEKGFNRLRIGGEMWLVTKRLDWYQNKLHAIFGGAKVSTVDGYHVFCARKMRSNYSSKGRPA